MTTNAYIGVSSAAMISLNAAEGDCLGAIAGRIFPADENSPDAVDLGVLTIDESVADGASAEKALLFLPGRLTDGIEPSDDPLIAARNAAYGVSFGRRSAAP